MTNSVDRPDTSIGNDKIKQGMKDAIACASGECDCPETVYTIRNRHGRVAITNNTTGQTTIYPVKPE